MHIEELIHALRELGHEVRVVAPTPGGDADMGSEVGWVRGLRDKLPKSLYECLEIGYSVLAYWRLAKAVKEFKPDVIYERYNLYLLAGLMASRRFGLPLLLEVNAPLVDERIQFGGLGLPWLGRWAETKVWCGADLVLPVTQVLAGHVLARGVPADRIVVIPNGINESHFADAPTPQKAKSDLGWPDSLILGFTGFVRDWHGVDRVLRWLANPDTPANARLLVVGDGPARADLERLAAELGIADRVRFTGVVPRAQVPALVAAFDVALQPAVVPYASPLKLFEYLALGKAIVAPRQPNILEVLNDGENALLFDARDSGALEDALTKLCKSTLLRESLAVGAASSIARLRLTWRSNALRVSQMGQQLAQGLPASDTPVAETRQS